GGDIMRQACGGVTDSSPYRVARQATVDTLTAVGAWEEDRAAQEPTSFYGLQYPDYILGVLLFSLTVIAYTAYGGFWAVTWTDVLQGIMIVAGAVLLMVLALTQVGGLTQATNKLREMDPRLVTGPGPDSFLGP